MHASVRQAVGLRISAMVQRISSANLKLLLRLGIGDGAFAKSANTRQKAPFLVARFTVVPASPDAGSVSDRRSPNFGVCSESTNAYLSHDRKCSQETCGQALRRDRETRAERVHMCPKVCLRRPRLPRSRS